MITQHPRPLPATWWQGDREERFWLETSKDRWEIGEDLQWHCFDSSGRRRLESYHLADEEVFRGDIVFHLDLTTRAIVASSLVDGDCTKIEDDYWEMPLKGQTEVSPPVLLSTLEAHSTAIQAIVARLAPSRGPQHLPFVWTKKGGFGLRQGAYLAKLPADVVRLFPALKKAVPTR